MTDTEDEKYDHEEFSGYNKTTSNIIDSYLSSRPNYEPLLIDSIFDFQSAEDQTEDALLKMLVDTKFKDVVVQDNFFSFYISKESYTKLHDVYMAQLFDTAILFYKSPPQYYIILESDKVMQMLMYCDFNPTKRSSIGHFFKKNFQFSTVDSIRDLVRFLKQLGFIDNIDLKNNGKDPTFNIRVVPVNITQIDHSELMGVLERIVTNIVKYNNKTDSLRVGDGWVSFDISSKEMSYLARSCS